MLKQLKDEFVDDGGRIARAGDAAAIDAMMDHLEETATADDGWRVLFRHRETGQFWELSFANSEGHGGGPRQLSLLTLSTADDWN